MPLSHANSLAFYPPFISLSWSLQILTKNHYKLQRSLKSTQRSTKPHSRPHVTKTNEHGRKLRPTRKLKTKRRKYYELLKYC
jgi:hypothetical protein